MTIEIEQFTFGEAIQRGKEWAPHDPITRTLIEGIGELRTINRDMLAAMEPFIRFYDDIRFNLRTQPRPTDSAVDQNGERYACLTWAQFYALQAAIARAEAHEGQRNNG